jgi:hypothetical protein
MNKQRTADKIVKKDIFSDTSSQGCSALFLKGKIQMDTSNSGLKQKAAHITGPPGSSVVGQSTS